MIWKNTCNIYWTLVTRNTWWLYSKYCDDIRPSQKIISTYWGRVTQICFGNLTIIGSDNGLSSGQCQAITWTNAVLSLIEPLGTKFSEILIEINKFSFKIMHLKRLSAKWWPFCLSLNVLNLAHWCSQVLLHYGRLYLKFRQVYFVTQYHLCPKSPESSSQFHMLQCINILWRKK